MRNKLSKGKRFFTPTITATLALAITFIISCTSDLEMPTPPPNDDSSGSSGKSELCNGVSYDPSVYRCEMGELIGKCNGKDYYPAYEQCVNNSSSSKIVSSSSSISVSSSSSVAISSSSSSSYGNSGTINNYCYGHYYSDKDCFLIGGMYVGSEQDCLSNGGILADVDYCKGNGMFINDTPIYVSSSSVALSSSSSSWQFGPSINHGGKIYQTVVIGEQTWFQRNLNYSTGNSKCYDDDPANCEKYGRLYDWATAMALPSICNYSSAATNEDCVIKMPYHQGICPSGWHIPTNADWDRLIRYADGVPYVDGDILYESETAGKHLRATSGWDSSDSNGEDTHGFSALPSGTGDFLGNCAFWWSASENSDGYAYVWLTCNYYGDNTYSGTSTKYDSPYSVRCIKD
jgi:uncharacterized protein (TIGR02145 family)